jgi:cytochrome c
MQKYICTTCHAIDKKIVGPAFMDVAKKYPGQVDYITKKIQSGGSGIWGAIPMPAQTLSEAEARQIATWIASGATK